MMKRLVILAAALLTVCIGCGGSKEDAVNEYAPKYVAKRKELRDTFKLVTTATTAPTKIERIKVDPRPVFDLSTMKFNTEIMAVEQLMEPESNPELNFGAEGRLMRGLKMTRVRKQHVESGMRAAAGNLPDELQEGLDTRYLVVNKVVSLRRPSLENNKWSTAEAEIDVLFIDLKNKKVLGSFHAVAASDPHVLEQPLPKNVTADEVLMASMLKSARKQLGDGLTKLTGGTFILEKGT